MTIRNRLLREVRKTRRKIQFERFLKGIAVTAAIALAASLVASYVLSQNNFSDTTIFWSRILAGLVCLVAFFKFVFWPLVRIPPAGAVARFLEERNPHLEDCLATAVENLEGAGSILPAVRALLLRDADRELAGLDKPVLLYPQISLISLLGFVVTGTFFLFLQLSGPAAYKYSLNKLLGRADLDETGLYSISVDPGNTRVVRHADLEIKAILKGFTSDDVLLVAKYESQPNWERARMRPDAEGPGHLFLLFDVRERVDYFVEADGIRSNLFTVDVSEAPGIRELEIHLRYPRHTGLGESVQKDDGDIRALAGTQVRLQIRTDQPVQAGTVKFEESDDIPLRLSENDLLEGSFRVERDDSYRIHLQNLESVWNAASDEYIVVSLVDQPPSITLSRPGRDKKVTNLEEVFVEAEAEDDFGIRDARLLFSVNGEPEESVDLEIGRYPRNVTTSTTFYLEDFDLLPGNFISYYARARDARSEAVTDIYFLEVLPYDREYSQSQQSGGAAGGEDLRLAKFQKEIIAATFNIVRDRQKLTPEELEEDIQTVAQMQEQLRQQAVTIKERIERRGNATDTPEFKQMVIYLTQAVEHMSDAHDQLKDSNLATALASEQKAYQKLLRSEALFKEIQIAMSSDGSASGNSSAEDLADLVDLELDRTKNQYETLQQNRDNQRQQELDELAERLKELARRQQQEMERRRRRGMQSSSSGGGASQQQFIEELEELARRLEKLSRQQRDQQLNDISRELKQAARDLRQGQDGNAQNNQMRLQQALDRMQQAREALNRQRQSDVRSGIEQLAQQANRLRQEQQDVVEELRDLESREKVGQKDQEWYQDAGRLAREKGGLQEELLRLESGLHQMARRIEPEEPEAAKQLKRAGLSVRDDRVAEKMREGTELLLRQWTMMARRKEEGVEEHLSELAEEIERAQEVLGTETQASGQDRSEEALNRLGDLVENLESLRQRASAGQPQEQQQGEASSSEQGSPRQGDEQSQQGCGEPSQQGQQQASPDGQQGQQGRSQPSQEGEQGQPSSEGQSAQSGQAQSQQGQQDGQRSVFGTQRPAGQASSLANSTGINPQQIGREWRERIQDAEKISELLREIDPRRARDIAQLAREMRRIDASRVFNDPEEIQLLRSQIIDGFKQLELDLYRELAMSEPDQLRLAFEEEIPPEYRSKVEEYYRKLAGDQD